MRRTEHHGFRALLRSRLRDLEREDQSSTGRGVNTHGVLLEVVQVLSELDLCINKAYISSDGGWFMDVFHVSDQNQNKFTDEEIIKKIMQSIVAALSMLLIVQSLGAEEEVKRPEARSFVTTPGGRKVAVKSVAKHTAIELIGTD